MGLPTTHSHPAKREDEGQSEPRRLPPTTWPPSDHPLHRERGAQTPEFPKSPSPNNAPSEYRRRPSSA